MRSTAASPEEYIAQLPDAIPFELIGSLCRKISVKQWIALYERCLKK